MKKSVFHYLYVAVALSVCVTSVFLSIPSMILSADTSKEDNSGKAQVQEESFSLEEFLKDLARGIDERDKALEEGDSSLAEAFVTEYEAVSEYIDAVYETDKELGWLIGICMDSLQNIAEYAELEEKTQDEFELVLEAEIKAYQSAVDAFELRSKKDIDSFELEGLDNQDDKSEQVSNADRDADKKKNTSEGQEEPQTVTRGMTNAVSSAKSYLRIMSFSYNGLIEMLEYEGFSEEEARYGADHCGADWYEQALKSGENYLDIMSFSYKGLIEMLEYEGFTDEQAQYAADALFEK